MRMQDIIAAKRDGAVLTNEQIAFAVDTITRGETPDYQAAALLMGVYLRGMNPAETADLTRAMAESGQMLDLSGFPSGKPTLDKHSTGGVGDKTSLVVVPILAAAGALVCKMSGRGLGHTGGTLDKLEAIPGFRVGLSGPEMVGQVGRIGACLAGQTGDLAPADKKLYALRDATATVGSLPLIVSSILSKKLAGGAQSFLFDVKAGRGALMETVEEARALAEALVDGARQNGRRAVAVLSDMNEPLGSAIGNSLEVAEAIQTLTPGTSGNTRFYALCVRLAAEGLHLVNLAQSVDEGKQQAESLLQNGDALRVFRNIVQAQGGDVSVVDDPRRFEQAPHIVPVVAEGSGFVAALDARELGETVVALGGGRARKEDTIDHAVGIVVHASVGVAVEVGQQLAFVHARTTEEANVALKRVQQAYRLQPEKAPEASLILGVVGESGYEEEKKEK